ncbi:hypothetical protein A3Q56_07779 [Intoshia linei]|uniref:Uncharacterized protein n=1 Tax=Intoshia linei TaxID=1819745 RepID=A0A177ASZ6_9BILA|nr:hypothetical protein A3Q56_07779 [Intoshia linei]
MRHWTKKEHPFDILPTNEIAERSLATMGSYINSVKSDTMLKSKTIFDVFFNFMTLLQGFSTIYSICTPSVLGNIIFPLPPLNI